MRDNFSEFKFYRAFGSPISNGKHKNIYLEGTRRPTNMPVREHIIIDDWFEHKFGIKARSSTIFIGITRESVNKYAQYNSCIVKRISFPNDSQFIYSLKIEDLFVDIEDLQHTKGELTKEDIYQLLENAEYQLTNNPESIPVSFSGEVMAYCHSFLLEDA
ncbi:hypothetical protein ACVBEE_06465 [Acinetobacter sp. ANC 3781]|uniref:hypothetical protein n=1 Tax=Acinetobacter sp. TaxID=472 RepID=UPI00199C29E5|nr:hypothetical protein [Acinetobacter sp.]MBC6675257.1 hypothetical protein [Acinetobacter sp.]